MLDSQIYSDVSSSTTLDCDQRNYNHDKVRIRKIFYDHYDTLCEWDNSGKARPCILNNVQKALICSTVYMGSDYFECPVCGNFNIIPRSCHGNLCQKCGYKRARMLANSFSSMAVDVPHRHMVFTIPEELRIYFLRDRTLLNVLFIAVRNTLVQIFNKSVFDKKLRLARKHLKSFNGGTYIFKDLRNINTFGMVATIHTFGRSLQWNPHIHALVTEAFYSPKDDKLHRFSYFNFQKLRKTFQYEVLRLMKERLGTSFSSEKLRNYDFHEDGWYVYAPKDESDDDPSDEDISKNIQDCISYFLRYTGRTPMAESRIDSYDTSCDSVDWWYIDHTTEQRVDVHDSAIDFIKKLIIHCPDDNFRSVRYYGFYANAASDTLDRVHSLLSNELKSSKHKRKKIKQAGINKLKYRTLLIDTFNRDPLKCSCGHIMEFICTDDPFSSITDISQREKNRNDRAYRDRCIRKMQEVRLRYSHAGMGH